MLLSVAIPGGVKKSQMSVLSSWSIPKSCDSLGAPLPESLAIATGCALLHSGFAMPRTEYLTFDFPPRILRRLAGQIISPTALHVL